MARVEYSEKQLRRGYGEGEGVGRKYLGVAVEIKKLLFHQDEALLGRQERRAS